MFSLTKDGQSTVHARAVVTLATIGAVVAMGITGAQPAAAAGSGSIGDFVWHDVNTDGIQDDWEPGVEGIAVSLHDSEGYEIRRTFTDSTGHYSFTELEPGIYSIGFENLPEGASFTLDRAGGDPERDSDVDFSGRTDAFEVTDTAITGIDAGIIMEGGPAPQVGSIGDFVWHDSNRNGIQDPGEWGIAGITVTLYDAAGTAVDYVATDADGKYTFSYLKYGSYSIGLEGLSGGWVYTLPGRGDDRNVDSDINPVTGRSQTIVVNGDNPDVTDVDAGVFIQAR